MGRLPNTLSVSVHERQIARAKELRQERISKGLCVQCSAPHSGDTQKCRNCTKKGSQAQWRWNQARLKAKAETKAQEQAIRGWNFETDDLIVDHVQLAKRMARGVAARQFSSSTVDVDELVGDALLGLVVAGRTFDETYGIPFGAWATTQIRGEIYKGIRKWTKCRHRVTPALVPLEDAE